MITLHFERGVAVFTGTGSVSVTEIMDALQNYVAHPKRIDRMPGLWDAREADVSALTMSDFKLLADAYAPHVHLLAKKVAIIIATHGQFELAETWQTASAFSAPQERWIFTTTEPAMEWLLAT